MPRLKDRQRQIPNGFKFTCPVTGWRARPYTSFTSIVEQLMRLRQANAYLATKHNWAMDHEGIANEVDEFNARICEKMGYTEYISGEPGGSAANPFYRRNNLAQSARNVAAGGRTVIEWLSSGAEAVPAAVSELRANTCATCEHNEKGTLENFFTRAASESIRAALNLRRELKLSTSQDDKLGVCAVCDCPLKLKVHLKIEEIMKRIPQDTFARLPFWCWIRKETGK